LYFEEGGAALTEAFHECDRGKNADARLRLDAGELDHLQTERRYIRKDGSVIWVRRTTSLARDIANDAPNYIFVVEDITARRMRWSDSFSWLERWRHARASPIYTEKTSGQKIGD